MAEILATYSYTAIDSDHYAINCTNRTACTKAVIPQTYQNKPITQLMNIAFLNAQNLKSVEIPEGITIIGEDAFSNCSALTQIIIPSSVTTIRDYFMSNCSSLKTCIMLNPTPCTLGYDAFGDNSPDLKIIVPEKGVDSYKSAANWNAFANKIIGKDKLYVNFINYTEAVKDYIAANNEPDTYIKSANVINDTILELTNKDNSKIRFIPSAGDFEFIRKYIVGYGLITASSAPEGWYNGETLISQDLNADGFTPTSGTFYNHTGNENAYFPQKGIFYYNGTKYISYYTNTGSVIDPVYDIVTSKKTYSANNYYVYDSASVIEEFPFTNASGTAVNLKSLLIKIQIKDMAPATNYIEFYRATGINVIYQWAPQNANSETIFLFENKDAYLVLNAYWIKSDTIVERLPKGFTSKIYTQEGGVSNIRFSELAGWYRGWSAGTVVEIWGIK